VSVVGTVVAREGASMIAGGGVAVIGDELAQAVEAIAKSKHIPETDLLTVVVVYQNLHQGRTTTSISTSWWVFGASPDFVVEQDDNCCTSLVLFSSGSAYSWLPGGKLRPWGGG